MRYMKLMINCETCDARKINEENYKDYEEITIQTEEMIVDERSKAIINRLPFHINAEEMRSEETTERAKNLSVNGVYEITTGLFVEEGVNLSVNGILKIAPKTEEILKRYGQISVNGIIICPKSIAAMLPFPSLSLNGLTKSYPDDYIVLDHKYKLDKYFPIRAEAGSGYFAATFFYDSDQETDFALLAEKHVKFSTDKVYLRHSHLEVALPLLNIEAKIVEVPDDYQIYVAEKNSSFDHIVNSCGKKIFVIGDVLIGAEYLEDLEKLEGLVVDGTVRIDGECVDVFNHIGAMCSNMLVLDGFKLMDKAMLNIDKNTLESHPEGVMVSDCALVKIDPEVPARLIRERLKLRDCAKVTCSREQESAVSEVSRDVALIGGIGNSLSRLFKGVFSEDSDGFYFESNDDTKYVNAEYYEL